MTNPTQDTGDSHHSGNQMALENVRQRLRAYFGDAATVIAQRLDKQYAVAMTVPLKSG